MTLCTVLFIHRHCHSSLANIALASCPSQAQFYSFTVCFLKAFSGTSLRLWPTVPLLCSQLSKVFRSVVVVWSTVLAEGYCWRCFCSGCAKLVNPTGHQIFSLCYSLKKSRLEEVKKKQPQNIGLLMRLSSSPSVTALFVCHLSFPLSIYCCNFISFDFLFPFLVKLWSAFAVSKLLSN